MEVYPKDHFEQWVEGGCSEELSPRASEFFEAMTPLNDIKPVLSSRALVNGWLDQGAFSGVIGGPGVGKTFYALDMTLHIAAGQNWHGNRVPPIDDYAGPVVYVAGEGGRGIDNRIAAIRKEMPHLTDVVEKEDLFGLLKVMMDFCGSDDAVALANVIEAKYADPSLIVIDTLAMAFGGGDENTSKDMGQFVANCRYLRAETGAHVMVVHHSGKDATKGARGSSSLRGALDTEIQITRTGAVIRAEVTKQRDMPCEGVFSYTLRSVEVGRDDHGEPVTSAVVEEAESVKKAPHLSGQQKTAMKAFEEAMNQHGQVKHGDPFPANRQCVSLEQWRECCDRMSLSSGDAESSKRTAFHKVKAALQDKEIICVMDGFVWRISQ